MSEKVQKILGEIKELTLLEASQLVKGLEEAFGVSAAAAAPVVVAGAAAAGGAAAPAAEKNQVFVVLTTGGSNKNKVIKTLREVKRFGFKEGQNLGDRAPENVEEGGDKKQG